MLEPYLAQMGELIELNEALTALRLEFIRRAQADAGSAGWSAEADARTREIAARARAHHSGEWLNGVSADARETDPILSRILLSSRDLAMEACVLLHRTIMDTPVVGCDAPES